MSIDHNRIKVSDLEKNQPNKILTTNIKGELEFSDINSIKVDSYNALDYTTEGKVLDARQGKLLKDLIDNINIVLASDNINLNTLQKLVDTIEVVQNSLNTLLVNDLTTGGTTKALTAEMGKVLQNNKVDKVAGERLINASEISKISTLTGVTTTVKLIASSVLPTQNVAGFVTYINALNPILIVGANEIVKYTTSDTGRTFELNLRGRSFGIGQPAIITSNVIEVTEFLNKDLKLSNYPVSRNDGQLATNKVLSTDINGNLKMYSIPIMPAPYLKEITSENHQPGYTDNFIIKGSFFTPTMTVTIQGQTINYLRFISDNEVHVNVTTGNAEGSFSVTLDNGIAITFPNVLLIFLGTVYTPTSSSWTSIGSNIKVDIDAEVHLKVGNLFGSATWQKLIPANQNFRMFFKIDKSPLVTNPAGNYDHRLCLIKTSDSSIVYGAGVFGGLYTNPNFMTYANNTTIDFGNDNGNYPKQYEIRRVNGEVYVYLNGIIKRQFVSQAQVDMYIQVRMMSFDIIDIKYVETN